MRALVLVATLLLPCFASAAVRLGEEGITRDPARSTTRRGGETLHAVKVDRRWFESTAKGEGRWLPGSRGNSQFVRFRHAKHAADGTWTWVGTTETDIGPQSVVITFGPGAVFAHLPQQRGAPLRLETRHGRTWLVEGTPTLSLPGDRHDALVPPDVDRRAPKPAASLLRPASIASPALVDVLVVWTSGLLARYGTEDAVRTRIAFIASLANQAYADSQAGVRIRIVAARRLDYTDPTDNGDLLGLVSYVSDSPLKAQVDVWRAEAGADLVAVLRPYDQATQTTCGLAWIGGFDGDAFAPGWAYSVSSDWPCSDRVLVHELGHNMGLQHDYDTAGGAGGVFPYSRGYRQVIDGDAGFATVMAYSSVPQHTPVLLFSNPRLNHCVGHPCGVKDFADNARSLTEAGPAIAAIRATTVPVLPALTIGDVRLLEGHAGTQEMVFTVKLSQASSTPVTYDIATADGNALADDYIARTLVGETIPPGATSRTFAVTIRGDTEVEWDATFAVALANVSGASLADGFAEGVIVNDDGPTLSIGDVVVSEGNSGSRYAHFTVRLSAPAPGPVTYNIRTAGATASAGSDFLGVVREGETIPAGTLAKTFSVVVLGDAHAEWHESFTVAVTSVVGATVTDGVALGTIANDDTPKLSVADVLVAEGQAGTRLAVFVVTLSGPSMTPVTFAVDTGGGTATAGVDYSAVHLTNQSIPAGALGKGIAVPLLGDATVEPNETYQFTVSAVSGATVVDGVATGYVLNDDGPTLSVLDTWVVEGDAGTRTATFTVRLSQPASVPVTFDLGTRNGTALAGSDFIAKSLTGLVIPAGQTMHAFTVVVNGDVLAEPNEVFYASATNVKGASVLDGLGAATLANDEGPTLAIADLAVAEGEGGASMLFKVSLSAAAPGPVTFTATTSSASALAGADFQPTTSTQTIAAGDVEAFVYVPVLPDVVDEPNEAFVVRLSGVTGPVTVRDEFAVGTILDDD